MKLSVIVCTRNRAHGLRACLDSIVAALQAAAPVEAEIILVKSASAGAMPAIEWTNDSPFSLRVFHESRPGMASARNRGMRAAKGDLLVFIGDDCRLDQNYIMDMLRHDVDDATPVLRGGRIEPGDPSDQPIAVKPERTLRRWSRKKNSARYENLGNTILGCNMAIRRVAAEQIGPFDEDLDATSGLPEYGPDADYIFRLYLAGMTIEYVPDMAVYRHHGWKQPSDGTDVYKNRALCDGAVYAKHIFKNPDMCRHYYLDFRQALAELPSRTNKFVPVFDFSYRDRILFCTWGAIKYWYNRGKAVNRNRRAGGRTHRRDGLR